MLALIPLLAIPELAGHGAAHHDDGHHELSLVAGLSGWAYALAVVAAIAAVVAAGQFLSRPCSVPSPPRACARPLPPRR
jgi:CPA2 family monovalent cation:H+ antiporter-2